MNNEFWLAVLNRLKSFLWRFGVALITFGLAWLTDNVELLTQHPVISVGLVYLLNEATKAWNTWTTNNDRNLLGFRK